MTVDSSMSSGYCSLEEELEDCFFTAKTTFFKNVQSKHSAKVNLLGYERLAWAGVGMRAGHPLWSRRAALPPANRQSHVLPGWVGSCLGAL